MMKKRWIIFPVITLLLIMATAAYASSGGEYEISFYTIDGGGGTSSGGVYEVTGTIGQHDASEPISGGIFSLFGGFRGGGFRGGGFLDYFNFLPLVLR